MVLRDYDQGQGKPRIIILYTEMSILQKLDCESVREYAIGDCDNSAEKCQ